MASPDVISDRLPAADKVFSDCRKAWLPCELVLGGHMPRAIAGRQAGPSLLFSMHDLFERYVALSLRERLVPGAQLETQPGGRFLCVQEGKGRFALRPDIVVRYAGRLWLLDTKWKRLDRKSAENGIRMQDVYQLYAYGQQWLGGEGDVLLVYPDHAAFPHMPPPLSYQNSSLRLISWQRLILLPTRCSARRMRRRPCSGWIGRRPAKSERKNRVFSAKRQAVWFETHSVSN